MEEKREFLSRVLPFWSELSKQQQSMLVDRALKIGYDKNNKLNFSSKKCTGVNIVKAGQVRLFITNEKGNEITLFRLVDGDICLLSAACLFNDLDIDINMEMEKDSEIIVIPKNLYKELSERNESVNKFNVNKLSNVFSEVLWLLKQFVFSNTAHRLADDIFNHISLSNSNELKITHDVLAKDIGTAREVVTRLLKQFQIEGIVRLKRGKIEILNFDALSKI